MADILTYWRTTNRLTKRSVDLDLPDTAPTSDHIGDFVDALPVSRVANSSDFERTIFALVVVTDIPRGVLKRVKRLLCKGTEMNDVVDRPRIVKLDIDLLKAEYPAFASRIDKLFDPEFTVEKEDIPSITWTKFKKAVWDKVGQVVVADSSWETDE